MGWFAQQKAEEREAKRAEKERLAAEKAERRQIMTEKRRSKLVRQQQMAREAYEKALELLKKQEANLLHKTEVVQMEIGEESNIAAQMMNDVFAFNTAEESEETEEMDSRMTAVQCAMPAAEEFPFLASTALDKIN